MCIWNQQKLTKVLYNYIKKRVKLQKEQVNPKDLAPSKKQKKV